MCGDGGRHLRSGRQAGGAQRAQRQCRTLVAAEEVPDVMHARRRHRDEHLGLVLQFQRGRRDHHLGLRRRRGLVVQRADPHHGIGFALLDQTGGTVVHRVIQRNAAGKAGTHRIAGLPGVHHRGVQFAIGTAQTETVRAGRHIERTHRAHDGVDVQIHLRRLEIARHPHQHRILRRPQRLHQRLPACEFDAQRRGFAHRLLREQRIQRGQRFRHAGAIKVEHVGCAAVRRLPGRGVQPATQIDDAARRRCRLEHRLVVPDIAFEEARGLAHDVGAHQYDQIGAILHLGQRGGHVTHVLHHPGRTPADLRIQMVDHAARGVGQFHHFTHAAHIQRHARKHRLRRRLHAAGHLGTGGFKAGRLAAHAGAGAIVRHAQTREAGLRLGTAAAHHRERFAGGVHAQIVTGQSAERTGHLGDDGRTRFIRHESSVSSG
ncbi:hypothetical protein METUNv1_01447 [Methyloversatilis universalis FAM5]|uniref:Uncharacterized protein n=1 Tax=Methyloversatilis universalis (strain ATCC BAA-1314 / DSM 25237 / JCM 13912 / CCUG 52030 / FAM5) TaxID=1000565 RepID=F5RAW0_METUF|nr:hypothetical protein METUNv1_01447 [Methyloversatilis universalis FAM5]